MIATQGAAKALVEYSIQRVRCLVGSSFCFSTAAMSGLFPMTPKRGYR